MKVSDMRSAYILERLHEDGSGYPLIASDQRDNLEQHVQEVVNNMNIHGLTYVTNQDELRLETYYGSDFSTYYTIRAYGRKPNGDSATVPVREYRISCVEFDPYEEAVSSPNSATTT